MSLIFYLLHDIIGALNYPNYNWLKQAVSDLTAVDSQSFVVSIGYVTIYKMFSCLCCALVCILVKDEKSKLLRIGIYLFSIMTFISAIGYALFPLSSSGFDRTFQSIMHIYVITTLVVLLSIISLVMIAIGSLKGEVKHNALGILAISSLSLMFIGAIGCNVVSKEYFGLVERCSTYSAVIFTAILGIYGFFFSSKTEK